MKTYQFLFALTLLIPANLFAQSEQPTATKQDEATIVIRENERTLQFKNIVIADKTIEFVMVNEKQYRWFPNKEKAIEYFKNMTLKQDWTVVYIDSSEPNTAEPDTYTLKEKSEMKNEK